MKSLYPASPLTLTAALLIAMAPSRPAHGTRTRRASPSPS